MAENLAGFAARCPLAESLVMVVAGIGGKPLFAGLAFSLMAFHKNTTESPHTGTTKQLKRVHPSRKISEPECRLNFAAAHRACLVPLLYGSLPPSRLCALISSPPP